MNPILTIRIYEDIDKPHEIEKHRYLYDIKETINQVDLYEAIRKAIDKRLQFNNAKITGANNVNV